MADDDTATTFTRRKFTIPERLDGRLQQLAAQHYQGNVSLCLRAAIKDHEATLTNNEALALHHVEQQVKSLATEIDEFREALSDGTQFTGSRPSHQTDGTDGLVPSEHVTHTEHVLSIFKSIESPLRLDDIIERCEITPEATVRACESLLDRGQIVPLEDSPRYQLATLETQQ